MTRIDWIKGDSLGMDFPAHAQALQQGSTGFLTRAFHASGSLGADNRVTRIDECREIVGGSTGRKLLLRVEYQHPSDDLHTELFVKFSRDFDDTMRDGARVQMQREVLLALLSRSPSFPIAVPACYYADFHQASGTGILITQRIFFDTGTIEPHYPKSLDYLMPDPLEHYRALVSALARLAGTHKAGLLPDIVEQYFPFEPDQLTVRSRRLYTPEEIRQRVLRYRKFCQAYPQVLPVHIRSETFIARLLTEAPRFQALKSRVAPILQSRPEMIALCHWNAHVDNAWFWRDEKDQLNCGLMDWGNVSQMNLVLALWGCLSAAELFIWDEHLDDLLNLFINEFERSGGPHIDFDVFKRQLIIHVSMMGLEWMLDAPALILQKVPDLAAAKNRLDAIIQNSERGRSQLLILSVFLNLWEKSNMVEVMDYMAAFE